MSKLFERDPEPRARARRCVEVRQNPRTLDIHDTFPLEKAMITTLVAYQ